MNILLVEDHPALARISCDLLRDVHGHAVRHAATAAAALAEARIQAPDLVLIDINLPDMSGYDLAMSLRRDPLLDGTRLVAVSGFGSQPDPERAEAAGIDAYFRKPVDFKVLPGIVRKRPAAKS